MTNNVPANISPHDFAARIVHWLTTGDYLAAERACRMCIEQDIQVPRIWFYLGVACDKQQKYEEASKALQKAINDVPEDIDAWMATAAVLISRKLYAEALQAAEKALNLSPESAVCISSVGVAHETVGNIQQAVEFYKQALQILPSELTALINLSSLLIRSGEFVEAFKYCKQALDYWPRNVEILNNLAEAYLQLLDFPAALESCDKALALSPRHASLHFKRGLLLSYLQRFDEARTALTWAEVIQPDVIDSYYPSLATLAKERDAEIRAIPELIFLNAAYHQQTRCDWRVRDQLAASITKFILHTPAGTRPMALAEIAFQMISLPIAAYERLALAKKIADVFSNQAWTSGLGPMRYLRHERSKIRIGYISPDFRQHPVGLLSAQLYGLHDRDAFEVYAYSLFNSPIENDQITTYIKAGCDYFTEVSHMKFTEIAERIHHDEIDILVDLAGYTTHSKSEVMAMRPAPLQVAYLGYPGTSGADFIDYVIVDHTIAKSGDERFWSEKLIRMPDAHCPFDTRTDNSPIAKTRAEYGLPDDAIVYCCFNTNYKIEPVIFDSWMRILQAVPYSVLWLVVTHVDAPHRLIKMAQRYNIDSVRLIFAGMLPHAEHIKRYQLADIFLDTYWHNAHTTAIDALWQGLPVITWAGDVPSSRLASSLLHALKMPELVALSREAYEGLAIEYGIDHQARSLMRKKLQEKRYTSRLFNIDLTVKHLETAYKTIWQKYKISLPPIAIDISA